MRQKMENKLSEYEIKLRDKIPVSEIPSYSIKRGYPFIRSESCAMLPIKKEVSESEYLLRPYSIYIWILFIPTMIYIAIILRFALFDNFFDSFFTILTITFGSSHKALSNIKTIKKFIIISLFLYGFILNNIYNAKLSTYLTTANLGKILTSLEDLKSYNVSLMVWNENKNLGNRFFTKYPKMKSISEILGTLFQFSNEFEFFNKLNNFDNTVGYFISTLKWPYIKKSQELLNKKLFSLSKICSKASILDNFLTPFSFNFYFYHYSMDETIRHFTIKIRDTGLEEIWTTLSIFETEFYFLRDQADNINPLSLQYFRTGWILLVSGLILSGFVLGFEMMIYFKC